MRGEASLSADRESRDSLAPKLRDSGREAGRIGEELFELTDLLDGNAQVERSLTDPSRNTADKVTLIQRIVGDAVHPLTLEILTDLVAHKWSRVSDIANAVEDFAVDAMMYAADAADSTLQVSVELAQIQSVLTDMPILRSKLGDESAPAQARVDLLHSVFDDSGLDTVTMHLIEHIAFNPRRRRFLGTVEWLIAKFSRHMGESMVTVTTATALTHDQMVRLVEVYSAKLGRQVHVHSVVDPSVLGGMRVQVGDEVWDNTVVAQLDALKRSVKAQV